MSDFKINSNLLYSNSRNGFIFLLHNSLLLTIYLSVGELSKCYETDLSRQDVSGVVVLFFSFLDKGAMQPVDKLLRKRNFYYKPIKSAYKRFVTYQEEIEKPTKIAQATKDNPYYLYSGFYTFDNKVYQK